MDFGYKSEFNDAHVQQHRRRAAVRPDRLADDLPKILSRIAEDLEQPDDPRISLLKNRWEEIAGKAVAVHSEPQYIDKCILYIAVDHAGWMPELQKVKRTILAKIQKVFIEQRPVRDIRFTLSQRS